MIGFDSTIRSDVVALLWLIAVTGSVIWYRSRATEDWHRLHPADEPMPTPEEAAAIRHKMIADAFLFGGACVGSFYLLAVFF